MPTTPRGIWTPGDNDGWDLVIDWAATANSIDSALDNLEAGFGATFPTVADILLTTPADGTLARAANAPGATFVRAGGIWQMSGVPVFTSAVARDNALTAPMAGWRSRVTSENFVRTYISGSWRQDLSGVLLAQASASSSASTPNQQLLTVSTPTLPSGQEVMVYTNPAGISQTTSASYTGPFLTYTTNGTAPTTGSPSLGTTRAFCPPSGVVTSAPGMSRRFVMPSAGVLRVTMWSGTGFLYAVDGQHLSIVGA